MRIIFKISGLVQGIGYRWFVRDAARKYALTGLVRNRADGSVEGEAQGDKEKVEAFVREIRTAHPMAEVNGARITETADREKETDFIIDLSR